MQAEVALPGGRRLRIDDGLLDPWRARLETLGEAPPCRLAFAAAHLVMRPGYAEVDHSPEAPGDPAQVADHIDWEATLAVRRRLDALGLGIAEAMDTAQRFAIGWESAARLIRSCGAAGLEHAFVAGAGADQLAAVRAPADLVDAVVEQAATVQDAGGVPMLLPLPWLSRSGADEATYVEVHDAVIRQLPGPLAIHWLGEAFLPELAGYFPGDSFERVMALDPEKVKACKLSLLDPDRERRIRERLLPRGQFVLTGDDFHFAGLIRGDGPPTGSTAFGDLDVPLGPFSHALLGILDGVAAPASLALRLLDRGDVAAYEALMGPCEALGRVVFEPPTARYKAGLAFIAWLNGWQDTILLANHEQRARDTDHYLRVAAAAAAAGALTDAPLAARRLECWLVGGHGPSSTGNQ